MPAFPTTGFLLDVSAAGAALAGSLLLGTVAARVLRALVNGRRARAEQVMRPMVLAVVSGGEIPAALISPAASMAVRPSGSRSPTWRRCAARPPRFSPISLRAAGR